MADHKDQESSEESDDSGSPCNQTSGMKLNQNHPGIPKETVLEGSSSAEGLTNSTGGKSTEDLNKNSNDLPEDKEIQSSSEDEE